MSAVKRRPFSNGTSFDYWKEHNCASCTKAYDENRRVWPCPLERALDRACIGHGTITPRIAERLGFTEEKINVPACPEKKPVKEWTW